MTVNNKKIFYLTICIISITTSIGSFCFWETRYLLGLQVGSFCMSLLLLLNIIMDFKRNFGKGNENKGLDVVSFLLPCTTLIILLFSIFLEMRFLALVAAFLMLIEIVVIMKLQKNILEK